MISGPAAVPRLADAALRGAAGFWWLAAIAGQWAFFYYIAAFYGATIWSGELEIWNRLAALGARPYVAGDTMGNFAFGAHALGAGIIAFGGALQLLPWIRARAPAFHRWNGRVFLATVTALSLSGFYLVWIRGEAPDSIRELSTTLNGLLILGCAVLAYRHARARNIAVHRRWALRLYLVSNAQWFLRVGAFAYFAISGMLGRKAGFGDPFMQFWTFGCYLVPLAVLELYLRARDHGGPHRRLAVAGGIAVLTLAMAVGIAVFAMFSQKIVSGAPLGF